MPAPEYLIMPPDLGALFIDFDPALESPHWLGGKSSYSGAICPTCQRPLLVFLSLDLTDLLFQNRFPGLKKKARAEILGCSRCELIWSEFRYRLNAAENCVDILDFCPGDDLDDVPPHLLAPHLPKCGTTFRPVPMHIQELYLKRLIEGLSDEDKARISDVTGDYAHHEVGSYPVLHSQAQLFGAAYMQQGIYLHHSSTGKPMKFLATLPDERKLPFSILKPDEQLIVWYEPEENEFLVETRM
jgi:hypothetical protein